MPNGSGGTTTFHRKLKVIEFTIGGLNYECQVQTWNMSNNTDDGDKLYSFCNPGNTGTGGEFREDAEPDYALEITFYSDWRSAGISQFLTEHDQEIVAFKLDHHPDIPEEHVHWSGSLKCKAPSVGGDARTTEMTEVTLQIIGLPVYGRAEDS